MPTRSQQAGPGRRGRARARRAAPTRTRRRWTRRSRELRTGGVAPAARDDAQGRFARRRRRRLRRRGDRRLGRARARRSRAVLARARRRRRARHAASPATARRSTATAIEALAPDGVELECADGGQPRLVVAAVRRVATEQSGIDGRRAARDRRRAVPTLEPRADAGARRRCAGRGRRGSPSRSSWQPAQADDAARGARAGDRRRPARAPAARRRRGAHDRRAAPSETATVARRGALDHAPAGAPARDAAARRGRRRRRDRRDEGDVLQPAVARSQLPAGDAAGAARQVPGRATASASSTHAIDRARRPAAAGDGPSPTTRRPRASRSTQILALRARAPRAIADALEPLPARACASPSACPTGPRALAAAHFGDREGGRRRLAFDELLLDQLVLLRRRARRREADARPPRSTSAPTLTERWLRRALPFALTGDQRARSSEVDADLATRAADAAAADGRGRLGQDRRRAARDAARGRARRARPR